MRYMKEFKEAYSEASELHKFKYRAYVMTEVVAMVLHDLGYEDYRTLITKYFICGVEDELIKTDMKLKRLVTYYKKYIGLEEVQERDFTRKRRRRDQSTSVYVYEELSIQLTGAPVYLSMQFINNPSSDELWDACYEQSLEVLEDIQMGGPF